MSFHIKFSNDSLRKHGFESKLYNSNKKKLKKHEEIRILKKKIKNDFLICKIL